MAQAAENVNISPRVVWKYLVQITIVFVAYFAAGKLGQATANIRSSNLGPVWPAYGIALAALLLYGYRVWVGIAAAAFLVAFFSPVPHVAAVGQAAGATLAALIGAFLLRIAKFHPALSRLRDALALIVLGALGSAMVSASIGVSVLYATHVQAYTGIGSAWLIYWLGDSTGVLLVTPLVLTAPNLLRIRTRVRIAEFAALLLLLTLVCIIVFGDLPLIPVRLHFLAFAVLPFVIWAAIRFGVSGAALSTLIVAAIATVATAFGSGPFAQNTSFTNAVLLDVFFAVLSVSGLTLAAVIAEREKAESERERLAREQAAMEAQLLAGEALRESEARFRDLAEQSRTTNWEVDPQGLFTYVSHVSQASWGYRPDEVVGGMHFYNLHPEEGREAFKATVFAVVERRQPFRDVVHALETKDGRIVWASTNGIPLFNADGTLRGYRGSCTDINERKLAEDMLKESRETLRSIFDSSPDSITVVDLDGRIELCNQVTAHIHGFSSVEQLIGKSIFELIAEEDRQRAEEIKQYVMIQGIVRDVLFTGLKGNGEKFPGELSFALLKGASGRPTGFVGITRDITERKRAEEALSDMNRRVIEAEERERSRIAWDLHEDIGQRLALLAIAIEQLKNNFSHQAVELLDRMDAVRKQTLEILTDVKATAHELYSPRLEYLGIAAVMRSFCEEFGERKRVKIDFRNDGVPSLVQPDVGICLFRVLQEALHNGVKHSGVKKFEVQLWGASDAIHLKVRDYGAGFDPDAARKGRGLGLTRIEQRVKLVKGTFSIDSQPEKGTTVHVSVPLDSGGDSMRAAG